MFEIHKVTLPIELGNGSQRQSGSGRRNGTLPPDPRDAGDWW